MTMTISTFDIFFVSLHLIEKIDTLLKLKKTTLQIRILCTIGLNAKYVTIKH